MARRNWPPSAEDASNRVTSCPRSAAETAAERPAGPAPTTATLRRVRGRRQHQRRLVARARVHQAGGPLVGERVVQAGLVAADARVDLVGAAGRGLLDEQRVGQERPGHRHQVRAAGGEDLLGHLGGVDPVGGAHRDAQLGTQPGGGRGPGRPRHLGDDRRDPRLVPADAGVDHRGAGRLDLAGQRQRLVPGLAVGDQVEKRHPVHHQEVLAERLAHPADDLDGEAHPVLRGAAPPVGAVVGVRCEELVDQVALGAHDLDAVVARAPGQPGSVDVVADGPLDPARGERAGLERSDRRLGRGRRDVQRGVAVAAGVQHLQRDRTALGVHRVGDLPVAVRVRAAGHHRPERQQPAAHVGRVATGHDQPGAAAGTLREVRRELGQVLRLVLQPGVHRPHHRAVAQREVPDRQRGKEMWVRRHGVAPAWAVRYSVSQSTQNRSRRMPPRSTRWTSRSWPSSEDGSGRVRGELLVVRQPGRVLGAVLGHLGQDGRAVAVRRTAELHGDLAAELLHRGVRGDPARQLPASRGGHGVDLLGRTRALRDGGRAHPAVGLHAGQHAVDLLVRGAPEEPDGPVEAPGEVEPGRGSLGERDQDRVLEGHPPRMPEPRLAMQRVAHVNLATSTTLP